MSRPGQAVALIAAVFGFAAGSTPVAAVVIASDDGSGNTASPRSDVPWAHVGRIGDLSAVYLGHRWVLTAAHVGAFPVEFAGETFAPLPGSRQSLINADGSRSDLLAFRIDRSPRLPLLPIARSRPPASSVLILAGNGHDRGPALEWSDSAGQRHRGWQSAPDRRLRWGTNRLDALPREIELRGITTRVLAMGFTPPGAPGTTPHEAQVVVGDSGGAVFAQHGGRFVLAGILILRSGYDGQPEGSVLFGNRSFAADLSKYRDQLLALTRPDCADERDNDDDGATDFPDDPGCLAPNYDSEEG